MSELRKNFVDECGMIEEVMKSAVNSNTEICAIGLVMEEALNGQYIIKDYSNIQELEGAVNERCVFIPSKISYSLIRTSIRTGLYPIIMHSHVIGYENSEPLRFSNQDILFMETFSKLARHEGVFKSFFALTNGKEWIIEEKQ